MDYTGVDEDGNTHVGWIQEQANSCGPACVYMLLAHRAGACLPDGEKRIRTLITQFFTDSPGVWVERLRFGYERLGVELGQVVAALRYEGVPCTMSNKLPDSSNPKTWPLITRVMWADGSSHFITCVGLTARGKVVVLDPIYGLQHRPIDQFAIYLTEPSPHARSSGRTGGVVLPPYLIPT